MVPFIVKLQAYSSAPGPRSLPSSYARQNAVSKGCQSHLADCTQTQFLPSASEGHKVSEAVQRHMAASDKYARAVGICRLRCRLRAQARSLFGYRQLRKARSAVVYTCEHCSDFAESSRYRLNSVFCSFADKCLQLHDNNNNSEHQRLS